MILSRSKVMKIISGIGNGPYQMIGKTYPKNTLQYWQIILLICITLWHLQEEKNVFKKKDWLAKKYSKQAICSLIKIYKCYIAKTF